MEPDKTVSTINELASYEKALRQWKENGGLEGLGGAYDKKTKKRLPAPEPICQAKDAFAQKLSLQIRAKVMAEPNIKL